MLFIVFGLFMVSVMLIGVVLVLGLVCIIIFMFFGGIYLNIDFILVGARWIRFMDLIFYVYFVFVLNEFGGDFIVFLCEFSIMRCLEIGVVVFELYVFEDVKVGI